MNHIALMKRMMILGLTLIFAMAIMPSSFGESFFLREGNNGNIYASWLQLVVNRINTLCSNMQYSELTDDTIDELSLYMVIDYSTNYYIKGG